MKNQALILLFATLLSVSLAAITPWGINTTLLVSNTQWTSDDFKIPELIDDKIDIVSTDSAVAQYGIKICLQTKVGLAHPARWNAETCTYYKEVAAVGAPVTAPVEAPVAPVAAPVAEPVAVPVAEPVTQPVAVPVVAKRAAVNGVHNLLPNGRYVLGVTFIQPPSGNYSYLLSFKLSGQQCDVNTVGNDCVSKALALSWNGSYNSSVLSGVNDTEYFQVPISNVFYGSVSIKTNSSIGLHLRRDGYPFLDEKQWNSNEANSQNGELTLNYPAPGTYYIAAINNINDTVEFNVETSAKVCNASADQAGPDCSQQVVSLSVPNGQMLQGNGSPTITYFKYTADLLNKTRLTFSVASLDSGKPTPQVFVRWGNLPDANNYDFIGCSTEYCAVNQVDLEILTGYYGDWYIGVMTNNEQYKFGIWHGTVCANNCGGDHGKCITEGEKMGTCACNEGFESIDCSVPVNGGLSAEMIVLIVMGALVVLSAIIGFIAWAYMRRKRGYDEIQ